MRAPTQPQYRSPLARLGTFLRDFLPEQNLQLLFPLGSFLLLLGASHFWYRTQLPGVFEVLQQRNFQIDPGAFHQFNHSYRIWVQLEDQIALALTRFAFLASLILWCLSVRKFVSRFAVWVFLPAAAALAAFQLFLLVTAQQRNAFLDAFTTAAQVPLPPTRPWFLSVGYGIYLAASGLIVLGVGVIFVCHGKISLPLRFRNSAEVAGADHAGTSPDGRDAFVFVIVLSVWSFLAQIVFLILGLLEKPLPWDSRSFSTYQWAPALANGIAAACLAFILLRKTRRNALALVLPKRPLRDYALAVAIPLVVVLISRSLLGVVLQSDWWTPGPSRLFIPHPLPWVLAIFVIAFFEEFALRGYLQTTLEKHLSLRRSIFLTGLLWSLLPLGFGMTQSLVEAKDYFRIPGLSYLAFLATLIVYSVPLGWFYARTRSIVATALMHGTIAIFHVGLGYEIHINRPEFYWMELALWIFIGWLLFKRYPIVVVNPSPLPTPALSSP